MIIFNQGNTTEREPAQRRPDLQADPAPCPSCAFRSDGEDLASAPEDRASRSTSSTATSYNVIADLHGVNDSNIVMAGAHLDSVPAGPGINDNGSGSAALLEVGQQLAHHVPQNTIRLAWWGAEELGLIGSTAWVGSRSPETLDRHRALHELRHDRLAELHLHGVRRQRVDHPAPVAIPEGRPTSRRRSSRS